MNTQLRIIPFVMSNELQNETADQTATRAGQTAQITDWEKQVLADVLNDYLNQKGLNPARRYAMDSVFTKLCC